MATRRPIVRIDGRLKELPAGDDLPGVGGGAGYWVGPTAPDPVTYPFWFNTTAGAFLVDFEGVWVEPGANFVPLGGTTGQALMKASGDDLDLEWADAAGGASVTTVEVDFGAGATSKSFSVSVAGATVGQKVIASPSLEMPAGVAVDELEMDPLMCAAAVTATDTVRLIVGSGGTISGKRNINLVLG